MISKYLNNTHYEQWLRYNFDDQTAADLIDTMAGDYVYPLEFINYCEECAAFDMGRTVYPILATPICQQDEDDEEINHEFHFYEEPFQALLRIERSL